jgi:hypothetical protein
MRMRQFSPEAMLIFEMPDTLILRSGELVVVFQRPLIAALQSHDGLIAFRNA